MIQEERARNGFESAIDLARAAGMGYRTVEIVEAGTHPGEPRGTTRAKLEKALDWEAGSFDRVLEGGQPTRKNSDPLLVRLLAVWPHLSPDTRVTIVTVVEALRKRG